MIEPVEIILALSVELLVDIIFTLLLKATNKKRKWLIEHSKV